MAEMYLVYVNKIGKDYRHNLIYEFIFSDTTTDVSGQDWDLYPASGRPAPPDDRYIKKVGRLESELALDVIQDSDTFAVWDSVDNVIALSWENIDGYEVYPEHRISFRFGEPIKEVEAKLKERELKLKYS